jgi:hypothetical protein
MLYEQIYDSSTRTTRKSATGGPSFASGTIESTTQEVVTLDEKLRAVEEEFEYRKLIGSLDDPNEYCRGIMPMRWGLYDDLGERPEAEPALVYFGGFDRDVPLVVGLGGSARHVIGHQGASSTYSRSATPVLVKWLLAGIEHGGPPKLPEWDSAFDMHDVYAAIAIAQHYLKPPTQNLEFVAKTLTVGRVNDCEAFIGVASATVILATPLWVAQSPPYLDEENHWGLDDQWETRDKQS